jgi:hypothetical protein
MAYHACHYCVDYSVMLVTVTVSCFEYKYLSDLAVGKRFSQGKQKCSSELAFVVEVR